MKGWTTGTLLGAFLKAAGVSAATALVRLKGRFPVRVFVVLTES